MHFLAGSCKDDFLIRMQALDFPSLRWQTSIQFVSDVLQHGINCVHIHYIIPKYGKKAHVYSRDSLKITNDYFPPWKGSRQVWMKVDVQ